MNITKVRKLSFIHVAAFCAYSLSLPVSALPQQSATESPASGNQVPATTEFSEMTITGFFDVVGTYNSRLADEANFSLGQAEIDLERQWSKHVSLSIAIAYNNVSSQFELGAAELEAILLQSQTGMFREISVTAGQFDVPFGLDYRVLASIDRKFVTAPWFVDTHGGWRGWNDIGVKLYFQSEFWGLTTYWVNGFEESAVVTKRIINLATGVEETTLEEIDTTPSNAFGAQFQILPLAGLEIGASLATGLNNSNRQEMYLAGAHAEYTHKALALRAEAALHSVNRSIAPETHQGYYFQTIYKFTGPFIMARYSSFAPHAQSNVSITTIGSGYQLAEETEIRFETNIHSSTNRVEHTVQLVTGL